MRVHHNNCPTEFKIDDDALIEFCLSFLFYHVQFGSFHSQPKQLVDYRVVLVNSEWNHTTCK